jgi:hypothetical protein
LEERYGDLVDSHCGPCTCRRDRLERAAVQMIDNFRTYEPYAEGSASTSADFQEVCRRIKVHRAWEAEMSGA